MSKKPDKNKTNSKIPFMLNRTKGSPLLPPDDDQADGEKGRKKRRRLQEELREAAQPPSGRSGFSAVEKKKASGPAGFESSPDHHPFKWEAPTSFKIRNKDLKMYNYSARCRREVDRILDRAINKAAKKGWTSVTVSSGLIFKSNDPLLATMVENRIKQLAAKNPRIAQMTVDFSGGHRQVLSPFRNAAAHRNNSRYAPPATRSLFRPPPPPGTV